MQDGCTAFGKGGCRWSKVTVASGRGGGQPHRPHSCEGVATPPQAANAAAPPGTTVSAMRQRWLDDCKGCSRRTQGRREGSRVFSKMMILPLKI
ncbi:hypothetical protein B296_00035067 [Ensete ventricosum]|uniref:Uncharacterized protein n=1 Tax=Ensete ventricosum TaxID=4639 RepID=A0A426Z3B8_ENSVE|nr:hypothetical protein B296_00035067 [Ensete ventricosum]